VFSLTSWLLDPEERDSDIIILDAGWGSGEQENLSPLLTEKRHFAGHSPL
jgi:hypothetical protein